MPNDFPEITKGKGLRIPHSEFRIPDSGFRIPNSGFRMDNYRVAFTRFLAFYSDNPSGLHDGETPAKWQSKASFATHPSTETEWPPKLLTRFSS